MGEQAVFMRIRMITPAPPGSRAGNRTTALRWARILRALGHRVELAVDYRGEPADLMIALHAWRSAAAVARFRATWPDRPLILALTGTDLYRFAHTHPEITEQSLNAADRLVVLHALAQQAVARRHHAKLRVIYQSAKPLARRPSRRTVDVCVIGHLREEKDPFRAAWAVRDMEPPSRLRIVHLGKGHSADWERQARAEMKRNPRYHWRGELPQAVVRQVMARSHAMVMSSRMEGGANVVSEAIVAGLPVLASDIPGNVGLLGRDYPGYYPVEDTAALAELLRRVESDARFYRELRTACRARRALFRPVNEQRAWRALLAELCP